MNDTQKHETEALISAVLRLAKNTRSREARACLIRTAMDAGGELVDAGHTAPPALVALTAEVGR